MAIQFNPDALSMFSNVNFGQDDAIANLNGGKDGLVQNGTRGLGVFAKMRFKSTKANNNAVRTELLKALGQAFGIDGVTTVKGGKTKFSDGFMRRLEEILGPEAFKRGDFGIKNGVVDSGKPLTQRRITAIVNAARAKGEEAVDEAGDDLEIKGQDRNIGTVGVPGQPDPERGDMTEDSQIFSFDANPDPQPPAAPAAKKHEMSANLQKYTFRIKKASVAKFKRFYDASLQTIENAHDAGAPVSKEAFDSYLEGLFKMFGPTTTDNYLRRMFCEMLAERKIDIFDEGGKLRDASELKDQILRFRAIADKVLQFRPLLGTLITDIVFSTVKSMTVPGGAMIDPEAIRPLDVREWNAISEAADDHFESDSLHVITSETDAKQLVDGLNKLVGDAHRKFDADLKNIGDSKIMNAIKRNLFTVKAMTWIIRQNDLAVSSLQENYTVLAQDAKQRAFMDMFLPMLESDANVVIRE